MSFRVLNLSGSLRVAEKLVLGFLAYALIASLLFQLFSGQRLAVWVLNIAAGGIVILLSRFGDEKHSPFLSTVRDWLPCVLIVLAYRESGLFFTPDPTHHLDKLFVRWDDVLLRNPTALSMLSLLSPSLQGYLEISYFLAYPLVPLGLTTLYWARRKSISEQPNAFALKPAIDSFWTAVILSVLTCYVIYPLFPLTPPRVLFHDYPAPVDPPLLRNLNFWVLGRFGGQASLFPSGHVAGATATALAVRARRPRLGIVFIIAAASVAVATVVGRYHYAADAVAGALVGIIGFYISRRIHHGENK